jgi:hypothetical protein
MPFIKGKSGNANGRPSGSRNKATEDIRNNVSNFVTANLQNIQIEYNSLEAKDKLDFISKLLGFVLPKLQAVQMDAQIEVAKPIVLNINDYNTDGSNSEDNEDNE